MLTIFLALFVPQVLPAVFGYQLWMDNFIYSSWSSLMLTWMTVVVISHCIELTVKHCREACLFSEWHLCVSMLQLLMMRQQLQQRTMHAAPATSDMVIGRCCHHLLIVTCLLLMMMVMTDMLAWLPVPCTPRLNTCTWWWIIVIHRLLAAVIGVWVTCLCPLQDTLLSAVTLCSIILSLTGHFTVYNNFCSRIVLFFYVSCATVAELVILTVAYRTSCCSTGSLWLCHCCPLLNNFENIDHGQVWSCGNITLKNVPSHRGTWTPA